MTRHRAVEAQQAIAANWTAAYVKYVGALPGGAGVVNPLIGASQVPASPAVPIMPGTPASPSSGSAVAPNSDGSCPGTAPVKVSKSGIYHIPGERDYAKTHAKSCFASASEAEQAGYRAPKG